MGARHLTDEATLPIAVGTVFERFPASVRGAVVVRAVDREPHQIRFLAVRVVQAQDVSKEVHRARVEQTTIDIAPHKEVLLPFDVPFTELGPGWFCVLADVEVDGSHRLTGPEGGGKRFAVPWPDEEIRRLDMKPNLKVGGAVVERVQSKTDRTEIRWRPPSGAEVDLKVAAGRQRLPVVETSEDPKTGLRTTVTRPLPRATRQLALELIRGRDRVGATLELP